MVFELPLIGQTNWGIVLNTALTWLNTSKLDFTEIGLVRGLVSDNQTVDIKAANAAILSAALTPNSLVFIPSGNYYTDELEVVGPVNIIGEEITTTLRNDNGSVFVLSGTQINVSSLTIRSAGGNHTIRQSSHIDQCHWDRIKFYQDSDNFSIWDNAGFAFVDMRFSNFLSWHTQTATVPSWKLIGPGGTINDNIWEKFRAQFSGNYHFWVESTDVNSQFANTWRDITWEVTTGGMIKLIGCRDYIIDNSSVWDFVAGVGGLTTLNKHGIHADTNAANALCIGIIRNHRRYDGTCDLGIFDIKLPSGVARGAGTILERCQNITSANPLTVDLNGNDCLVLNPGTSGSTLTTYANTTLAQFVTGTGITLPTTQAFKVGAVSAGMGFKASQAVDVVSIAANSEGTFTIAVPGAVVGDASTVSTRSLLEPGLSISSWAVTAPDIVTVRLRNNTDSAIDPSARTWDARVWR